MVANWLNSIAKVSIVGSDICITSVSIWSDNFMHLWTFLQYEYYCEYIICIYYSPTVVHYYISVIIIVYANCYCQWVNNNRLLIVRLSRTRKTFVSPDVAAWASSQVWTFSEVDVVRCALTDWQLSVTSTLMCYCNSCNTSHWQSLPAVTSPLALLLISQYYSLIETEYWQTSDGDSDSDSKIVIDLSINWGLSRVHSVLNAKNVVVNLLQMMLFQTRLNTHQVERCAHSLITYLILTMNFAILFINWAANK